MPRALRVGPSCASRLRLAAVASMFSMMFSLPVSRNIYHLRVPRCRHLRLAPRDVVLLSLAADRLLLCPPIVLRAATGVRQAFQAACAARVEGGPLKPPPGRR